MSSHRSFGSKRSKQSSSNADEDDRFSHAPAFAALRRSAAPDTAPTPDALDFQYMRQNNITPEASWSTFDLKTRKLKRSESAEGETLPTRKSETPWNWSTTSNKDYTTKNGECIAREVSEQFIPVSELMNEKYQNKTILEHRNADLMGNSGNNQIVSMIGSQELTLKRATENRFEHMDQHGNYRDGVHRGRPAKRLMDEWSRRNDERELELKKANAIWNEWNSLTPAQQAERKAEAERNRQITQNTLHLDALEVSELPQIYRASIREIAAKSRRYNSQQARSYTDHAGMPSMYTRSLRRLTQETQSYESTKASTVASFVGNIDSNSDFVPFQNDNDDDDNLIFLGPERDLPICPRRRWASSKERESIYRSLENDSLLDTPSQESGNTFLRSSSAAGSFGFSSDSGSMIGSSRRLVPPSLGSCPPVIPVQEVLEPLVRNINLDDEMSDLQLSCERLPRVATLTLTDKNVMYTSKGIVERLFGGAIQEIQFFPDLHKAIIVFLRPNEAKTFINHVTSAMEHSSHEARRLQFGATWYKGDSTTAIMPASLSVVKYTLSYDATRTLLVQGLPNTITADLLLKILKGCFANQHVVKATLVSPSKKYERAQHNCLAAIVEFEAIPQAITARDSLEFDEVPELLGVSATFVPDASTIAPAEKPWCKCDACRGVSHARSEAASLRHQDRPEEYDIEEQLLSPDSYAYGHEDKKQPRLTAYDVSGMRRHAREADRGRG